MCLFDFLEKWKLKSQVGNILYISQQYNRRNLYKVYLDQGVMISKRRNFARMTDIEKWSADQWTLWFENNKFVYEVQLALDPFTPAARIKINCKCCTPDKNPCDVFDCDVNHTKLAKNKSIAKKSSNTYKAVQAQQRLKNHRHHRFRRYKP